MAWTSIRTPPTSITPPSGRSLDARAAPEAAEADPPPLEVQRAVGDQGRGQRRPRGGPGPARRRARRRALRRSRRRAARSSAGVLGAPVMAGHPGPGVELSSACRPPRPSPRSRCRAAGSRSSCAGPACRRAAGGGGGAAAARRGPKSGVSQAALRPCASARPRAPSGPKWLGPRSSQSPARGSGSDCLTAKGLGLGGVEQRAPERACRAAAGPLEDGVADPGRAAARRVGGAQVVGLVVAAAGGDGREARGAHRSRERTATPQRAESSRRCRPTGSLPCFSSRPLRRRRATNHALVLHRST